MAINQITEDVDFIKSILPDHYKVRESSTIGSVHCFSPIGIRKAPYKNISSGKMVNDDEDEKQWRNIFRVLKSHFGKRFQEVFHSVCFCHTDFTVYLAADKL